MRTWPDECVQCVVTSPPYWGLRDYGVEGQLGLEPTLTEYLERMVGVFEEVRRVLRPDGVLWMNMGDSYVSVGSGIQGRDGEMAGRRIAQVRDNKASHDTVLRPPSVAGLRPKNLIGQPWRLAFALQDAGWYLRSDIVWSKPNPMPESVKDRPTRSHEFLFLLTKSRRYFYDHEAIKEPSVKNNSGNSERSYQSDRGRPDSHIGAAFPWEGDARNKRDVWEVSTQTYHGAHFATFPTKLVEPCILAGSKPGDLVLDPFMGSGTTAQVAQQLGRAWVGCELNPEYIALQQERTRQGALTLEGAE